MKKIPKMVKVLALVLCQGVMDSSRLHCMHATLNQKLEQLRDGLSNLKAGVSELQTKLGELKKVLSGEKVEKPKNITEIIQQLKSLSDEERAYTIQFMDLKILQALQPLLLDPSHQ